MSNLASLREHRPKMKWEEYYPLHKPTVQSLANMWGGQVTDVTAGGDVTVTRLDGKRFFFNIISKMVIWEQDGGTLFSFFINAYERKHNWEGYTLPASTILESGFCPTLATEYLDAKNLKQALENKFFQEAKDRLASFGIEGVRLGSAYSDTRTVTLYRMRDFRTVSIEDMESTAKEMVAPQPTPLSQPKPKPKPRLKAR